MFLPGQVIAVYTPGVCETHEGSPIRILGKGLFCYHQGDVRVSLPDEGRPSPDGLIFVCGKLELLQSIFKQEFLHFLVCSFQTLSWGNAERLSRWIFSVHPAA
jgi:hypothetical protein